MHTISEDDLSELVWVRPKWSKREYSLRSGEVEVASMRWDRGTHALAQWGDSPQYELSRIGWLRQRVVVHEVSAANVQGTLGEPLATFVPHGGTLTFRDGRTFLWKRPKRLSNEHVWTDSAETELVRFHPAKHAWVVVSSQPAAAALPELPLLIVLGQYLITLAGQDAEAASTAAIVAVIASS